ncbi:MAG: hypothetical protein J6Y62_07150 [Clostridia bacterium]|nr:hypothetical protein [Clostridia bacterium]
MNKQEKKIEFADHVSPSGKRIRAVAVDGELYGWQGKTEQGGEIDVVAFVEQGWEPVFEKRDNGQAVWWEFKGVLRRGNVFLKYEEIKVNAPISGFDPLVRELISAGRFTLTRERFEKGLDPEGLEVMSKLQQALPFMKEA